MRGWRDVHLRRFPTVLFECERIVIFHQICSNLTHFDYYCPKNTVCIFLQDQSVQHLFKIKFVNLMIKWPPPLTKTLDKKCCISSILPQLYLMHRNIKIIL